jgi:CBS domain-containing protein
MQAKDLMRRRVPSVTQDDSVSDLVETLVDEHIHGAPVVDSEGMLVGVVTQQDIFFGSMTRNGEQSGDALKVKDIMTSPAVSADENTEIASLCRMMYKLRIHRVPIVRDGKISGIISSLDICAAISAGKKLP